MRRNPKNSREQTLQLATDSPKKSTDSDDNIDISTSSNDSVSRDLPRKKRVKFSSPYSSDDEQNPAQSATQNYTKLITSEHTSDVYDIRYKREPGKRSAYQSKFSPDRLVVDPEYDLVDQALNPILPSAITRAQKYKKIAAENFEQARQDSNEQNRKIRVDELTSQLKPVTLKALDFGSGDGRALEIWIKLAEMLKPHGIVLEVIAYDIVRSGVDSYKSKLTNPNLPQEYADALKEVYGERVYQARKKDPYFLASGRYEEDLKKIYEQDIPNENHSLIYGAELNGKKLYRQEIISDLTTSSVDNNYDDDFSTEAIALKKQYGEELYEKRRGEPDFPSMSDYAALKTKYQRIFHHHYITACQIEGNVFYSESDAMEYATRMAEDEINTLRTKLPKFPEIEKDVLQQAYGEEDRSLYARKFAEDEEDKHDETPLVEDCGTHQKDNLKIKFLLGKPELEPQEFRQILEEDECFDLSLILYGCLSHIPNSEKRDGFLEAIRDMTSPDGRVATTIPGQIFFREDLKKMDWMLQSGLLSKSKVRSGDVLYTATDIQDSHIRRSGAKESETDNLRSLFFATYSLGQLKELLDRISPENYQLFISSLANPSTISNSNLAFRNAERVASKLLSAVMEIPLFAERIDAGYYGVVLPGTAGKEMATQIAEKVETKIQRSESWLSSILNRITGSGRNNDGHSHSH